MKKSSFEKNSSEKAIVMGHPDVHRMIKDLVKFEAELKDSNLPFCKKLASVIKSNMDAVLKSRAAFVIL